MARESVTIEGLGSLLRRLQAFPKEMSAKGGPVRAGVRKGAVVIQKAMQSNVRQIVSAPNVGGDDQTTGLLEKSIKPIRAKAPQRYKGETFFVMIPRRIRYPVDTRTPTGIAVSTVGAMLEYGTSKRQPMPWARPAFHSRKEEAARVMVAEAEKGVARIEKKLAATIR
jgi:HK97 gp10 family phage protein